MIGIFDSGLGGLTVLKEIRKVLPAYDYMYLGDTLHLPYGNRSDEAIFELSRRACDYLFSQGCKLIIIACNTASAKALRKLQQEYLPAVNLQISPLLLRQAQDSVEMTNKNILGVVRPVAEKIAKLGYEKIGMIGTKGTVNSNIYVLELKEQMIKEQRSSEAEFKISVEQQATPLLVPLIEEGWLNEPETESILSKYLKPLQEKGVQCLILGCTHYPLLIKKIKKILGPSCYVPNPSEIVAESLKDYLIKHSELEKKLPKNGRVSYFVTDLNDNFRQVAEALFGEKIKITKVKY